MTNQVGLSKGDRVAVSPTKGILTPIFFDREIELFKGICSLVIISLLDKTEAID